MGNCANTARRICIPILATALMILILGFVFVGLTIALYPKDFLRASRATVYSVYWLGFMAIITATIGIIVGARRGKCQVVTFMILSITTCVAAALLAVFFLLLILVTDIAEGIVCFDREGRDCKQNTKTHARDVLYIVLVIDALLIWVGTLAGSILSCRMTCLCCGAMDDSAHAPEEVELTSSAPVVVPMRYVSMRSNNYTAPTLSVPSGMYGSSTEELPLYQPESQEDNTDDTPRTQ